MAMVFECYQRGILTRKDTDGLRLEWGNKEVILELVRKVAYREGFGDVLAEGCLNAARKIGKGAEKYAYHVKGKSHPDRITALYTYCTGFCRCHPRLGPPERYCPRYDRLSAEALGLWC